MSIPHVDTDYHTELESVAWRGARNFGLWHLCEKAHPMRTLCLRWIPDLALVSRRPHLIHTCEGCEQVRQHEVLKRLQHTEG